MSVDWFNKGNICRKTPYFIGTTMVSCRFSLKAIQWIWIFEPLHLFKTDRSFLKLCQVRALKVRALAERLNSQVLPSYKQVPHSPHSHGMGRWDQSPGVPPNHRWPWLSIETHRDDWGFPILRNLRTLGRNDVDIQPHTYVYIYMYTYALMICQKKWSKETKVSKCGILLMLRGFWFFSSPVVIWTWIELGFGSIYVKSPQIAIWLWHSQFAMERPTICSR